MNLEYDQNSEWKIKSIPEIVKWIISNSIRGKSLLRKESVVYYREEWSVASGQIGDLFKAINSEPNGIK